ncbi:MAG: 4-phosphoerythronate dehydrogenase [Bermanella sp.]
MKIVADENIPLLAEFFNDMCQSNLHTLPGRHMTRADLMDADILLVRSITQVNEELLEGTSVKFVGTCTIGTDHVDTAYLATHGIRFHSAPGCNAQAVVEYVLSSLLTLAERRQVPWQQLSVGIVGVGNVGRRLLAALEALQINVCAYDPHVAAFQSRQHSEAVWQQDVVTLHTPITHSGEFKTHHLVDGERLATMQADACLINSCRGAVVDNQALLQHLHSHPMFLAILDVWEQEPTPPDPLIRACLLATPHIAGYSLDGKYQGSAMIYAALCDFLALPVGTSVAQLAPCPPLSNITMNSDGDGAFLFRKVLRSVYDVRDDHFRMLSLLGLADAAKASAFDQLRKQYPMRRELHGLTLSTQGMSPPAGLQALGVSLLTEV